MIAVLGLLAIGTTLAIHVEEVGDVPPALATVLIAGLADAVEAHSGLDVVVDEDRGGCLAGQPCAAAIRSRTSALELLLVRLIGGPLRVRVVIEHQARGATRAGEVDVPREGGDPSAAMRSLVSSTLPPREREPPPIAATVEILPESGPSWVAVTLLGVGAASAATGVLFGLSSQGAIDDVRAGASPAEELLQLDDRARTHALLANVLWVVAAGALTAGVTAWLADF